MTNIDKTIVLFMFLAQFHMPILTGLSAID